MQQQPPAMADASTQRTPSAGRSTVTLGSIFTLSYVGDGFFACGYMDVTFKQTCVFMDLKAYKAC